MSSTHGVLLLQKIERYPTLDAFEHWLRAQPAPCLGGFDLPFGLPRELVQTLGWPSDWAACMAHYAALPRAEIRLAFKAFCDARPVGGKFAHRATDGPAGSSPSMKWVNPPVAFMLHAGVPRLLAAGWQLAGVGAAADPAPPLATAAHRTALEAYPGLLARELIGNTSYKSDDRAKQTPERLIARKDILAALESGLTICGQPLRLAQRLRLSHAQRDALAQDASGDTLDAVLCLVQAGWAAAQRAAGHPRLGLPACDPLEGWIVSA